MTSKPPFGGEVIGDIAVGNLGKTQSGGTPSSKHSEYFGGDIPWIGTTALNGGVLDESNAVKFITEDAVEHSATKIVPAGSIMVGVRVGVGKVAVNSVPMCTSQDIVSIIGVDEQLWNKEYISYAIQYKAPRLASQAQGATITGITSKALKAVTIPVREKSSQDQIVWTLNYLKELHLLSEQRLAKLDTLVKSRFAEMFGDTDALMSRWPRKPLMACVNQIDSGKSVNCKAEARTGSAPGVLKLSALSSGKYLPEENKAMFDSDNVLPGKEVMIGDILVARKNTPDLVGTCVLVDFDAPNLMFPDLVFRMHPIEGVDGTYLSSLLGKSSFSKTVRSLAHGSAKSMSNIPKSELEKLELPLPPLALQREFADFATRVDKLRVEAQAQKEKLQTLYDSLAQDYFAI